MHSTRDSTSEKQSEQAGFSILWPHTALYAAPSSAGSSLGADPRVFALLWDKAAASSLCEILLVSLLGLPQRKLDLTWVLRRQACTFPRSTRDPNILLGSVNSLSAYLLVRLSTWTVSSSRQSPASPLRSWPHTQCQGHGGALWSDG